MANEGDSLAGHELVEAYKELERLELALVKERERNTQLEEEQRVSAECHSRDVGILEEMLQQVLLQNRELAAQIEERKCSATRLRTLEEIRAMYAPPVGKEVALDSDSPASCPEGKDAGGNTAPRQRRECEEPEMEPRHCPTSPTA